MSRFLPTDEQSHALDLFADGDSLVIEAGAGTGKTSTLRLLADAVPAQRVQYLAFNKAIVTDAQGSMPRNVTASTAHSLAYRAVGHRFAHRLRSGKRMTGQQIARELGIDPFVVTYGTQTKRLAPGFLAGHVMRAVTRFCQTADDTPSLRHIGYIDGIDVPNPDGSKTYANNDRLAAQLLPHVIDAWRDVSSVDGRLRYQHDHYLKAWQLSRPKIAADVVMFDEAQDANPVMAAIVAAQRHAQLVYVGDSQQAIYGFTGAVNAMAGFSTDRRAMLTQSFRFGPAVATVANSVLGLLHADLRLVGTPSIGSRVEACPEARAVLCRTNATALAEVMSALRQNITVHLVGGGDELVRFARAADELRTAGYTSHPELTCFSSWGEVVEYVESDPMGSDLALMVRLVEEFSTAEIESALARIAPEHTAARIVSTAHKSKGREWESVRLADDFNPTADRELGPDELRLLYVAVTRAQLVLDHTAVDILGPPKQPTNGAAR